MMILNSQTLGIALAWAGVLAASGFVIALTFLA
jgi:hypothetical protein